MKKLLFIAAFLNCMLGFGQIVAHINGSDTLCLGQSSEYSVDLHSYPNKYLFCDTISTGTLDAGYPGDVITNAFSYDLWVKPTRSIIMAAESDVCYGGSDLQLANSDQNWAIVPLNSGDGSMRVGLTIGTNGIMVGEHSDNILVSRLSYSVAITDWVHIAIVYRTDSIFLYLDGNMVRSRQLPSGDVRTVSSLLAGSCDSPDFKGDLDEFRLWDISLTGEEINIIKDKKIICYLNGLRYYASFDNGSFERTSGDIGEAAMTVTGFSEPDHLKYSTWDFDKYSGSWIAALTIFDLSNISYLWSTGSVNSSISFSPLEGENYLSVKLYNQLYSKNALFSISASITIIGKTCTFTPFVGLVAYYPLNGNAADESVFRNDGTTLGPMPTTDMHGAVNKALYFDGIDDYLKIEGNLPVADNFTISFLAYSKNAAGYSNILNDGSSDTLGNDFLLNLQGTSIGIRADKDASLNYEEFPPLELQGLDILNKWSHIVWVMTPAFSKIYVNGVLKTTINESGSNVGFHNEYSLIGARNVTGTPDNFFKGKLDELKIYNRELSDAEVQAIYDSYDISTGYKDLGIPAEIAARFYNKIQIYPNPAESFLSIDLGDSNEFENGQIRIINIAGNIIYRSNITQLYNEIFLPAGLCKGVYMVQVSDSKNNVKATRKIILR
jgi:hypothetical protein